MKHNYSKNKFTGLNWLSKFTLVLVAIIAFSSGLKAQTTIIGTANGGNFELGGDFASNGWTVVNGAAVNTWSVGVGASAFMTNSAYITNGGVHTYTIGSSSTVHFYRDVTVPSGETNVNLSFNLICNTNDATWDELLVYVAPNTVTPVVGTPSNSGTAIASANLLGRYSATTPVQNINIAIPQSFINNCASSSTVRIIFTWKNDNSGGTGAPVALDDVLLTSAVSPLASVGTFTINNTLATTGSNFNNFTDAVNWLNNTVVCSPLPNSIVFNVSAGQVFTNTPLTINATGTGANTITFQKSGAGANPIVSGVNGLGTTDAVIAINGGDYLRFDGIDVRDDAANTTGNTRMEYGYLLKNRTATDGAIDNIIKNCAISLNRVNTNTIGILQTASTTGGGVTPTNSTGANANNRYYNLTISNTYSGIFLNGNATFLEFGNEIGTEASGVTKIGADYAGTPTGDIGAGANTTYGIRAFNQSGVKIFNCIVQNITTTAAVSTRGIFLDAVVGNSLVYNNKVRGIRNTSTTSTSGIHGMELINLAASTTANLKAYNNFISDITSAHTGTATATRAIKGILLGSGGVGSSYDIDNNSIAIDGSSSPNLSSVCLELGGSNPANNIRNNIFSNSTGAQAGVAVHCGIRTTSGTLLGAASSEVNYNNYHIANTTNGFVAITNTVSQATIAAFNTAITTPTDNDLNSVAIAPAFADAPIDLHSNSVGLDGVTTLTLAWVTTDIDGQARNNPGDIGADEYTYAAPACAAISALAAYNITASTAALSWTNGSGETMWDVEYGVAPYTFTGTPTTSFSANPAALSGLLGNTNYSVKVRANCGGAQSAWSSTVNFTTPCASIGSFPFVEGFESVSLPTCWTQQYVSGAINWASVTANGDGSISPRTGSRMAEFRTNSSGPKTKLITPPLNLTSLTTPKLKFYYANVNWTGDLDSLGIYYKTTPAGTWTRIGTSISNENLAWTEYNVTLPNPSASYYIALEGISGYGRGFNIDDFEVSEAPACSPVSNIMVTNLTPTTAVITWTQGGSETAWDIEYGGIPYTFTGTPTASYTTNVATLTSLNASTAYTFKVRANCGGTQSTWSAITTFTTQCNAITSLPYFEGFNTPNPCWSTQLLSGTTNWGINASGEVAGTAEGSGCMSKVYNNSDALLFSPAFNISGGAAMKVDIWVYRDASSDVSDRIRLHVNTNKSLTGALQILEVFRLSTTAPTVGADGWYLYSATVPASYANGTNFYLITQGTTAGAGASYGLGVDAFNLDVIPALDIRAVDVVTPIEDACFTASESVSISIENVGASSVNFATNNMTLTVTVGGTIVTTLTSVINTGTLAPGAFGTYTVGTVNMSAVGSYTFSGNAFIATEVLTGNNNFNSNDRTTLPTVAMAYTENFESYATSTIPPTWEGSSWEVLNNHGKGGSKGYNINVYNTNPSGGSSTMFKVGAVTSTTIFTVDYRFVNYSGYPSNATTFTATDYALIGISTDCGQNFTILGTFDDVSHSPTTSFTTASYNLAPYVGQDVLLGFYAESGGVTDYYFDIDNIRIGEPLSNNASLSNLTSSVGSLSPTFASTTTNYNVTLPFGSTGGANLVPTTANAGATTIITSATNVGGTAPANQATVAVTAEDGVTTSTYTVTYNVTPANSNSSLSALTTSVGTLSPVFASGTLNYTVNLPFGSTGGATVTPTRSTTLSTISSNTGASNVAGTAGANVATVIVTAQNGSTSTYTVTYNVAAGNSNADLSNLVPSAGSLSPAFASGTHSYTVTLPSGTTGSASVTPTLADATATVTSNTNATDVTTAPNNVATVIVTAQNGTTTATYTVTFNVAAAVNNDATLASLSSSAGSLNPAFASGTSNYTVTLPFGTTGGATLVPATTNASATTMITSATNVGGTSPANTATVVVTAQDGITTMTYTVTYNVTPANTNSSLSALTTSVGTLSPVFASGTLNYTVSLPFGTTGGANLTPTLSSTLSTVSSNTSATNVAGSAGANVATVVVTAQSGATSTYTVTYSVDPGSSNANLSNLVPSAGVLSPAFASGTNSYTVTLPSGTTGSASVTPTLADATATVTSNTNATDVTTAPNNVATVIVTAQNGTTTATYTVTFNVAVALANDATLNSITPSNGTLSPTFVSSVTNYTVTLPFGTTGSETAVVVTNNAGANAVVTPASDVAGTAPANTVTIVVTAQDGITTSTYTVVYNITPASTNSSLADLTSSQGSLNPAFTSGTFNYTVLLPMSSSGAANLTPTLADAFATVTSNTPATNVAGTAGANVATVVVTAQNGSTSTYTVTYSVATSVSSDATLSSLTTSIGTLAPSFVSSITAYTVSLPFGTTGGATVTAIKTYALATLTSVTNASNVAGTAGTNVATVVVTAENGATMTYTVTYSVAAGNADATLSNLTSSQGALSPAFAAGTFAYTVTLPAGSTGTGVLTPTLATTLSTVSSNVSATDVAGSAPANTATIVVTAQDGSTATYTVVYSVSTGIDELANTTKVEVYPNPTHGIAIVKVTDVTSTKVKVSVVSLAGQVISETEIVNNGLELNHEIDLSKQPKGVYFVKVTGANNTVTKRVITF
ncbi:MAG: cadherin-like beta sandwich domain-containing protein [Bacteroidota bacterium]